LASSERLRLDHEYQVAMRDLGGIPGIQVPRAMACCTVAAITIEIGVFVLRLDNAKPQDANQAEGR
jgi:hypothetical protein